MGSVGGRVLNRSGEPIEDAVVMVAESTAGHRDIALMTDSQGTYRLEGLDPGEFVIVAHLPDGGRATARLVLAREEHLELDLVG